MDDSHMTTFRDVAEMDEAIDRELVQLANRAYGGFTATGAFLFLYDRNAETLEPAFDSKHRSYHDLHFVSSTKDKLVEWTGIASIAFQEQRAFSKEPGKDKRMGVVAQQQRETYGIPGSMMAVRLGSSEDPLGVIVVYSDQSLAFARDQELAALDGLQIATAQMTLLLKDARILVAERDVERYSELVFDSIHDASRGLSIRQVLERAAAKVATLFGASSAHIKIGNVDESAFWHPSVNAEAAGTLDSFAEWRPDLSCVALNREHQSREIHRKLSEFGADRAWCRASIQSEVGTCTVVLSRQLRTFSDHWTDADAALLTRALELLTARLSRARDFDELVQRLDGSSLDFRGQQFRFWCYLLKDYFGIDQVLVTKVCRKPTTYKVKTQLAHGFPVNPEALYSRPKILDPPLSADSDRPDVMVRILMDYLDDKPEATQIYVADCDGTPPDRFCLDVSLVGMCKLRGKILFVPCYTVDPAGTRPVLRSILHLGASSGDLRVTEDQYPLLMSLGQRVAEWLAAEDQRTADELMRTVRDNSDVSVDAMASACSRLAEMTQALGCTLFVNATHLSLLRVNGPSVESLESCFVKLLQSYDRWSQLMSNTVCTALFEMIAAFLGTSKQCTDNILRSPDTNSLARVLAHVVYIRVAHSSPLSINADSQFDVRDFCRLVRQHSDLANDDLVRSFGVLLAENTYLPGYGLTGWVLRYVRTLRIMEKNELSIKEAVEGEQLQSDPVWRQMIVDALRNMDVPLEDSTLHTEPYQFPHHARHIFDHSGSTTRDAYLGCPIEAFGFSELPVGVIRICGASRISRGFGLTDESAVFGVARHLANVLRSEHVRQQSFLETIFSQRGEDADFRHMFARLDEGIGRIRELVEQDADSSGDDDLPETVARLAELCDKALAAEEHRAIALNVRGSDLESWSVSQFCEGIAEWLHAGKLTPNVHPMSPDGGNIGRASVVYGFRTTEEIVRNMRRYQGVEAPHVSVSAEGIVYVSTQPLPSLLHSCTKWVIHEKRFARKGGGTKVLADAYYSAGIIVEYASPDDDRSSPEVVARITLPPATKVHA